METNSIEQIRADFERQAHGGYVSNGLGATDGYYAPEPLSVTRRQLRQAVPVTAAFFRYGNDWQPSQTELDRYNATFEVGASWRPDHLDVAVGWQTKDGLKWRTYVVTGTRHAYYLIRKLAGRTGFVQARLQDWLVGTDGYLRENVISIRRDDVTNDRAGKFGALLDRNNSHYDLERDDRERAASARRQEATLRREEEQRILDDRETQSDRDAWYDMDH